MPPAIWRTAAGLALFALFYTLLLLLWMVAVTPLLARALPGPQALTLLMLTSFATGLLALALVMRLLHGQALSRLLWPLPLTLRQGGRVLLYVLPLVAIISLLPMPAEVTPVRHLPTGRWLALLLPGLLAIAIQISAEECLFRGYLQGRLAGRFRSPLMWLVLPAALFGSLHYAPEAGDNAPWLVASATLFGLVAGDLTARSGTLGPALALHFINNVVAILGVSFGDELGGLALFHLPITPDDPLLREMMPGDLATTGLLWLTARLALRR